MRPLYLVAFVLALTVFAVGAAYILGTRSDAARDANTELQTIEDFQDATSDDRDRSTILERLRALTE